jgi:hypothetical protein
MAPTSVEEIGKTSKILSSLRTWACYTTFSSKKKKNPKKFLCWHEGLDESFPTHQRTSPDLNGNPKA